MEDNEDSNIQEIERTVLERLNKFTAKLLETLFAVFYVLFKDYNTVNRFETKTTKPYVHIVYSSLIAAQVLSLTFPPNLKS